MSILPAEVIKPGRGIAASAPECIFKHVVGWVGAMHQQLYPDIDARVGDPENK